MSIAFRAAASAAVSEEPYALASITPAISPVAEDARDWHCYVITQGSNRIVGHRPGSLESVRLAAEDLVGRLNARRSVPSGRRNLVIGPTKKS
jgi:hypothetical protein